MAQRRQRAFPVAARLVRVDGDGVDHLAGGVDHRDLDAGADARVEADGHARAGGCGQQQVVQVAGEDADRLFLGALAQGVHQLQFEVQRQLDHPGPARGLQQPAIGGAALVANAEACRHHAFAGRCARRVFQFGCGLDGEAQHAFVAAAQQRQRAVRGDGPDGFAEVEPVAELGAFGFLARDHGGDDQRVVVEVGAQFLEQGGVLAKALHQDLPGAVERGLDVGHVLLGWFAGGVHVLGRLKLGAQRRVAEQRVGQRLEPGLARHLRLGAALGLVGQVEVLEALLGVGALDLGPEFRRELALLVDGGEHGGATFFEFAQVAQALFEVAQLGVVELTGDFLAVAGDEGDAWRPRRAAGRWR